MVDPKIEAPLRKMLGHVMRGELDELGKLIEAVGPQMYEAALPLCVLASGYISVDISKRWPGEADVKALARHAAAVPSSQVTETEIIDYLSRIVLAGESPLTVFPDAQKAAMAPLFATADLLVAFSGNYADQWSYLDAIWNAIDAASQVKPDIVPAVVFQFGRK